MPLPKFLYGEAKIVESYDETLQCFRIHVQVRNPLIGSLFSYKEHLWKGIDDMKNIIFGLACYVVFLIYEWSNINPVEAIILLSVLLFIPMSFCIIDKRKEMDRNYYFINPYHFYIQSQQFVQC